MENVKHPKIMGLLTALMVLFAVTGLVSALPLAPQSVDIITKDVTLYKSPDTWDNTGEIYVTYNTGGATVTTGTQTVVADSQKYNWYASPYSWTNLPYTAYALTISIWDVDPIINEKLYEAAHSLSLGTQLVISSNSYIKVTTEVTLKNP